MHHKLKFALDVIIHDSLFANPFETWAFEWFFIQLLVIDFDLFLKFDEAINKYFNFTIIWFHMGKQALVFESLYEQLFLQIFNELISLDPFKSLFLLKIQFIVPLDFMDFLFLQNLNLISLPLNLFFIIDK